MLYMQVDPWAKYELNLKKPRTFARTSAKRTHALSQVPDNRQQWNAHLLRKSRFYWVQCPTEPGLCLENGCFKTYHTHQTYELPWAYQQPRTMLGRSKTLSPWNSHLLSLHYIVFVAAQKLSLLRRGWNEVPDLVCSLTIGAIGKEEIP